MTFELHVLLLGNVGGIGATGAAARVGSGRWQLVLLRDLLVILDLRIPDAGNRADGCVCQSDIRISSESKAPRATESERLRLYLTNKPATMRSDDTTSSNVKNPMTVVAMVLIWPVTLVVKGELMVEHKKMNQLSRKASTDDMTKHTMKPGSSQYWNSSSPSGSSSTTTSSTMNGSDSRLLYSICVNVSSLVSFLVLAMYTRYSACNRSTTSCGPQSQSQSQSKSKSKSQRHYHRVASSSA